jgi:hypothetical protein
MAPAKKPAFAFSPEMETVVRNAINQKLNGMTISTAYTRKAAEEELREAAEVFLYGRIVEAKIVMYDRTPIVRVVIRHNGKLHTVDKTSPLASLSRSVPEAAILALLPLLPQDQVALQMADIENAAAAALQDPKKLEPIHQRLAAKRAADKERMLARLREVFRGHDDLVSEDEILQLWRETMCAEVMES